ncbi:MAG: phosphoribosylformylglycinamidine cyclo-ligase [Acidobacteriaceae bacterium]
MRKEVRRDGGLRGLVGTMVHESTRAADKLSICILIQPTKVASVAKSDCGNDEPAPAPGETGTVHEGYPADGAREADAAVGGGRKTSRSRAAVAKDHDTAPTDRHALAYERITGLARRTFNRHVLSEIGGFAGLFALDGERFPDAVMVAATNGVGGKLKLAIELGLHSSIGVDLVNHCVNDIAIQGATPLFFMDYFATGRVDPQVVQQVTSGLVDACKANGCALLGGETAEAPWLYREGSYELAGFMTGAVSRSRLLTGDGIRVGDCLLGLASNGLHTTGYGSALKSLLETAGYRPEQYVNEIGDKVGAAMMRPHRSYLAPIRKLMEAEVASGFAHITGGGLTESLPRILPRGVSAQIDLSAWEVPPLFAHLQRLGGVEMEEMLRTYNMGIGLVAAVPPEHLKKAQQTLKRMNERWVVLGRVTRRAAQRVVYG